MFNYEVTKDFTPAKVKTQGKTELYDLFKKFLVEQFGEENVGMVQSGSTTSPKRELGFIFGTVVKDGVEIPLVATINPTVKEFYDHKSDKGKEYNTFVFADGRAAYDKYAAEKEQKVAEKAAAKAAKIAKD